MWTARSESLGWVISRNAASHRNSNQLQTSPNLAVAEKYLSGRKRAFGHR